MATRGDAAVGYVFRQAHAAKANMLAALSTLAALTLIGIALFIGGLLLRRVPGSYLAVGAIVVLFGLGIPAIVIDDNKAETSGGGGTASANGGSGGATSGGGSTSSGGGGKATSGGGGGTSNASAEGKLIFSQSCGTCHTLKDAGTNGQVGPVLDQVKPNKALVLSALKKGGLGSGTMPANIVTGKDAQDVATYVSSVAGK
jgi:mono/diheme cytochrome c family protein